ncbi:MAG: hypothetical protein P8Y52_11190 [Xanthomonadales bacterium]|jgi:hypothetical protein
MNRTRDGESPLDSSVARRSDSPLARWGLLITEMVLIVASILLAFALDSWWDERKDRVEEQAILQGLRAEFELNRTLLERRVAQHTREQAEVEILRAATVSGAWTSADLDLDTALAAMLSPPTTDLGNGVLDALISSGRIELLQNRELRAQLAAWRGVIDEVLDDEQMNRDLVFDRTIPYFIAEGIPLSGPMSYWSDDWGDTARSLGDDPEAVARLLGDPRFKVLLEARLGFRYHTSGEYRTALEAVDDLLAEIDRSLGN